LASTARSDLPVRAATGLVAILVAVAALWFGGVAFWTLVTVLALAMAGEWAGLMHLPRKAVIGAALALAGPLLVAAPFWAGPGLAALVALGVAAVVLAGFSRSPRLGAGILYAGLPALSLLFLRAQTFGWGPELGLMITFATLVTVWLTDIGAYFAGRTIGGPKLAPRISPNKTWAGLLGGMAAAGGFYFALLITNDSSFFESLLGFATGAGLAVLAQAGDLFESWLKRRAGVKDSGHFLPGHGGAMDRLDGVVPVACAVALAMLMVTR